MGKIKSLTLVETMVAAVIFAILALTCAAILRTGLNLRAKISSQQVRFRNLYLSLEIMARQLRNSIDFYKGSDSGFKGDVNKLEFYSLAQDYVLGSPQVIKINYDFDGQVLFQRFSPALGLSEFPKPSQFITGLKQIEFSYFGADSKEPSLSWDGKVLPQAIKISLLYVDSGSNFKTLEKFIYIK